MLLKRVEMALTLKGKDHSTTTKIQYFAKNDLVFGPIGAFFISTTVIHQPL